MATTEADRLHIGRTLAGHHLEDSCPCPQEPCGLIDVERADSDSAEHGFRKAKTLHQGHPATRCPDAGDDAAS